MDSGIAAWEREYINRGCLWAGAVRGLPNLPPGSIILELGCGNGKTLSAISECSWETVALDSSQTALKLCRMANPNIRLVSADASHLPFRDKAFDAVFAFHITGHLSMIFRNNLAKETTRVLRNEGRLFFREFELNDMRKGQGEEVEPNTFQRGNGIITHYFSEREVADLFYELEPKSLLTHRWKLQVKGKDLYRSEIEAVFSKTKA